MKHTVLIALIAAAGLSLTAGTVIARGEGPREPVEFSALDTNGDGQITLEEMEALGQARMARADTDGDGFLTLEELQAQGSERANERAQRLMERADANDDGKLSPEELRRPERAERRFERVDTDGDGAISEEEFAAMHEHRRGHGHKRGASDE